VLRLDRYQCAVSLSLHSRALLLVLHQAGTIPSTQDFTMSFKAFLKKLEVKPIDDEYESLETTRWGNRDTYPIPHDKRTYGWLAFWACKCCHSSTC
jgi:hypothetical protein